MGRKRYNFIWMIMIFICIIALVFSAIFAGATVNYTKAQQTQDDSNKKETAPTYYYEENSQDSASIILSDNFV